MSLLFDVTMYGRFNEIRNSEKRQFTMASNNDKKLTSTEIVIQEIAETIQYCGCTTKIFMNTEIFTPSES